MGENDLRLLQDLLNRLILEDDITEQQVLDIKTVMGISSGKLIPILENKLKNKNY